MLVKVNSAAIIGLDTVKVVVEVNISSRGFPSFDIVGLANKSVSESKERVKAAIINSGFEFPNKKIIVNLAPADLPKEGSHYDLSIAVGILAGEMGFVLPEDGLFLGELSLDGHLRATKGALLFGIFAQENGFSELFLSKACSNELKLLSEQEYYSAQNLEDVISHLTNITKMQKIYTKLPIIKDTRVTVYPCYEDIIGQHLSKKALEIAVAGGHNILMHGPPGGGKTMLAKATSSICSFNSREKQLEAAKMYSIVGNFNNPEEFLNKIPFRSPHNSISYVGLVGGHSIPRPGEISLAHNGILFLDEFPEFQRQAIEALRQPLEEGTISITRSLGTVTFPADFLLIATANACPCGYKGHPKNICQCTPRQILNYKKKLSGPILDRIDLHVHVPPVEVDQLLQNNKQDLTITSKMVSDRVLNAKKIQQERFIGLKTKNNARMTNSEVNLFCSINKECEVLLKEAVERLNLSARAYFKILKASRTIADLENSDEINESHITLALQFRQRF